VLTFRPESPAHFSTGTDIALRGTDYFAADDAASPVQHYWSLSIEEQFYFVWPALIFVIGLVIARRALTDRHRIWFTGWVMACVTLASLGWAFHETAVAPNLAYFNTFSRVWELGAGALLAISAGALARIPIVLKPWLSWTGICLIGGSALVIAEGSAGFPAPLALFPVAGSALVIAAGIGREPTHLRFLTNPFAVYIGNISYSLYLVHWPTIIFLGAVMAPSGVSFYLAVVSISFALAIASFHFVEDPLRHGDWGQQLKKIPSKIKRANGHRTRRLHAEKSPPYVGLAVLTLLVLGLTAVTLRPNDSVQAIDRSPEMSRSSDRNQIPGTTASPLVLSLQQEIAKALSATEWPILDPSMESVINEGSVAPPEMVACAVVGIPDPTACTWGSPNATTRMVLVGDSIALTYGAPMRELALNSAGKIQLRVEAMPECQFVDDQIKSTVQEVNDVCPRRKLHTIGVINATKPDVVIISDSYGVKNLLSGGSLRPGQWSGSMRAIVDKFQGSVKQVVWLSPPPADENVKECFTKRSSVPADCVSQVNTQWLSIADDEQQVAESLGGVWIDSRPWFCSVDQFCPAFVGSTPTKGTTST